VNSGPAARETFSRDDRLRKRREFEECYASGVRISGRFLQVFLRASSDRPRLGISVPKRTGNAAVRNRLRRRVRELFRREREIFGKPRAGVDLVVHVRPPAAGASFADLSAEYRQSVRRALERRK
jgi:ribonuclease P protein component